MVKFSCPCCEKNLRKWGAVSGYSPWWKFNLRDCKCNYCGARLTKTEWRNRSLWRLGVIFSYLGFSVYVITLDYVLFGMDVRQVPGWAALGLPLALLCYVVEYVFSKRPLYVLSKV